MRAVKINEANFREEVLESENTVLLDFWASWCGPCRMIGPIVDEIAGERSDIKVCKINVDEEPHLAARYNVMSIPTLMVMQGGQVKERSSGAKSKAKILQMLEN